MTVVFMSCVLLTGCGFVMVGHSPDTPGFLMGVWHGLLAPWSLIARLFLDVKMYAYPNAGWFYDLGFLLGVLFSIPIGWIAAIIALCAYVLA